MNKFATILAVGITAIGLQSASAALITDFYVSAPNVQSSFVTGAGATTEDFNGFATGSLGASGSFAIGDYTANLASITDHDQFGGAGGSKYPLIPFGTTGGYLDITLASPAKYLGFWWSAGNPGNIVEFFSGGTKVATLDSSALTTFLNGGVGSGSSIGGSTYSFSDYYGQAPYYTGVEYAYIHLIARNGVGDFDRVRLSGPGFEFDNMTVSTLAVTPDSSLMLFGNSLGSAAIPEPGTWAAAALLVGGAAFMRWRRRQQTA